MGCQTQEKVEKVRGVKTFEVLGQFQVCVREEHAHVLALCVHLVVWGLQFLEY